MNIEMPPASTLQIELINKTGTPRIEALRNTLKNDWERIEKLQSILQEISSLGADAEEALGSLRRVEDQAATNDDKDSNYDKFLHEIDVIKIKLLQLFDVNIEV